MRFPVIFPHDKRNRLDYLHFPWVSFHDNVVILVSNATVSELLAHYVLHGELPAEITGDCILTRAPEHRNFDKCLRTTRNGLPDSATMITSNIPVFDSGLFAVDFWIDRNIAWEKAINGRLPQMANGLPMA